MNWITMRNHMVCLSCPVGWRWGEKGRVLIDWRFCPRIWGGTQVLGLVFVPGKYGFKLWPGVCGRERRACIHELSSKWTLFYGSKKELIQKDLQPLLIAGAACQADPANITSCWTGQPLCWIWMYDVFWVICRHERGPSIFQQTALCQRLWWQF